MNGYVLLQNFGTLTLLLILLPFNLIAIAVAFLWNLISYPFRSKVKPSQNGKRILLTGGKMTKALQLARSFHGSGHEVFLVESHKYWLSGHRFSKAVKGFYTIPAPEKDPEGYCQGLLDLVKQENIDVFIPVSSPVASYYDSLAKSFLSPYCEVIHFDAHLTEMLDNKFAFCEKALSLGLSTPKVFCFIDRQQILDFDFQADRLRRKAEVRGQRAEGLINVSSDNCFQSSEFNGEEEQNTYTEKCSTKEKDYDSNFPSFRKDDKSLLPSAFCPLPSSSRYLLKSIPYDSVRRLDLTKLPFDGMEEYINTLPISKDKPWVMQEFIAGQEYCTHSTVRNGVVRLHCCSKSSPFQVNYENVDNPQIYEWVKHFVKELNLTGQISFDFIQTENGTVYPIECNPRTHSAITMFYNHPGVADAYLNNAENDNEVAIQPLPESKPTYWLYHELWRLTNVRSLSQLKAWFDRIFRGTDALFILDDPLPFLTVHHWQIPLLLLDNLRRLKGWIRIDFNIGKLVELGGD
jgi:predicted ATP-grasp superfamily ATP-dependent carboligase